jgi:hypothetical protein
MTTCISDRIARRMFPDAKGKKRIHDFHSSMTSLRSCPLPAQVSGGAAATNMRSDSSAGMAHLEIATEMKVRLVGGLILGSAEWDS